MDGFWVARWGLVLGVGLLCGSGCIKRVGSVGQVPLAAADFVALKVGNRWLYDVTTLGQHHQQEVRIVDFKKGYFEDDLGGKWSVDSQGLRDEKRYLIEDPVIDGKQWSSVISVSTTEHYRVVQAGGRCRVQAVTFSKCIRVVSTNRVDASTTLSNEFTFAEHLGLVRIESIAEVNGRRIPQNLWELTSYSLEP